MRIVTQNHVLRTEYTNDFFMHSSQIVKNNFREGSSISSKAQPQEGSSNKVNKSDTASHATVLLPPFPSDMPTHTSQLSPPSFISPPSPLPPLCSCANLSLICLLLVSHNECELYLPQPDRASCAYVPPFLTTASIRTWKITAKGATASTTRMVASRIPTVRRSSNPSRATATVAATARPVPWSRATAVTVRICNPALAFRRPRNATR